MKIRHRIDKIIMVLHKMENRQVGHTTNALDFARRIGAVFVTHNRQHGKLLGLDEIVSIQEPDKLMGRRGPVVIDHHAYVGILHEASGEIAKLETDLSTTKNELEDVTKSLASTREQLSTVQNELENAKKELEFSQLLAEKRLQINQSEALLNTSLSRTNTKLEQQLSVVKEALEKISKQYSEGYNTTYPTKSTMTAKDALKKIQEMGE